MADDVDATPSLLEQMLRESGALGPSTNTTAPSTPAKKLAASASATSDKSFGSGLRGGFFDQAPRTRTKAQQQTKAKAAEIPTITRPSGSSSSSSSLVLPEVRAALDREAQERAGAAEQQQIPPALQALLGRGDWVTPELQERILATSALREALRNPRFARVLDELARDPQAALTKHKDDPAVASFIRALSGLLGVHFEALGQQQKQDGLRGPLIEEALWKQVSQKKIVDVMGRDPEEVERDRREQAAADEILRDPEVCALLLDPEVQAVLQACRDAQQHRQRRDDARAEEQEALARRMRAPEMADKLRRLAALGVLRFE